jgi:hypothetical protein
MLANPDIGVTQIADRLGVSPAMPYRDIPSREPPIPPSFESSGITTKVGHHRFRVTEIIA